MNKDIKILLLGDFSGFHKNLKSGLHKLGIKSIIVGNGDGWKKIQSDIDISVKGNSILSKIKRRYILFKTILDIKNYDVVQIMNVNILGLNKFPGKLAFKLLKKNNKKVFLLAAGSDSYFWLNGRKRLKYGPFDDFLKYDLKKATDRNETEAMVSLNKYMADNCNGIIPIMYEYEISYKGHCNLKKTIPIPINLSEIKYSENIVREKLVVFHGLNRPGFKGTHFIKEAFNIIGEKYPNDVELIIDGKMPIEEYLKILNKSNVVIDQVNSHSLGVNGVIALALGKVVIGGAEIESLESFGLSKSPVINIKPNVEDIVSKLECLILSRNKVKAMGLESRNFAESFHDDKLVASQFLDVWCTNDEK